MKIAERYATARHTSNLRSEPNSSTSASDVMGAAGMAAQQRANALLLWSVVYGGKTHQKIMLIDGLERRVCEYMLKNKLRGNPRQIATEVLAYYLHARCEPCNGVGYQIVPHTITRADEPCPECGGLGKPQPPKSQAWAWLHRYVDGLLSTAAGRIMQKISLDGGI